MMKPFRLLVATGAAALVAVSASASAQTFSGNEPTLQRIWRLGIDSSRVEWLAQRLLDSLGPRLTASPGMDRAQDWMVKMYSSWGIESRKEQYGTWRSWRRGPSHIDLIAPRVRTLEGTMLGYSPGTGGKAVEAEPIVLPRFRDSAQFRAWLPQARGKLVMISAAMPSCRPTDDWDRNATPASAERMAAQKDSARRDWAARITATGRGVALGGGSLGMALDSAGVAGVISSRPKDSRGAMEIFDTYNSRTPTIALSCEDYGLVYRLADNKMGPRIRMSLESQSLGEKPVFNVIGTMKGSTKPNEYVMMSAHFDSWDGSSGATDNGTGTLTMMEAMRILKQVLPNPQRTILVGHWSSEENGLVGSRAWAEDHQDIVKGMQGLFNQDNGTGRIQNLSGGGWPDANNHLLRWWDRLPREFQQQAPVTGNANVRPGIGVAGGGSDNASFACYGAPTFGLGAAQWDYSNFTWHTDKDTYDKVVFDDLKGNATLTAMLVYMASEDPEAVKRDTTIVSMTRALPPGISPLAGRGGGRGGRGGNPDEVIGRVVRSGDSVSVVFTMPNTNAVAAAGGDGRGGGRGGGGRAGGGADSANARGGGAGRGGGGDSTNAGRGGGGRAGGGGNANPSNMPACTTPRMPLI
ncbi:MAG TPA: M28 family peptidase, partial [Gemmatimonadaceae bacterium]|nr:M28 family peptidase [Gemmatimonadaceae bacterium]